MMRLSKKYVIILLIPVLIANMIYILPVKFGMKKKEYDFGNNLVSLSDVVSEETTATVSFAGDGGRIDCFRVFFSTHNRENSGTLSISLREDGNSLETVQVPLTAIEDNQYYEITGFRSEVKKGSGYSLQISAVNGENSGVSVWYDENDNLVGGLSTNEILYANNIVNINIVFLAGSYVFCRLIQALRRKT